MSPLESFSKWIQLKIYQLEVTFSVYIFTPLEKFFFWSIVFLLFSLTFLATVLYLPQHISFILGRAWFYIHGESVDVDALAKGVVSSATATAAVADAARQTAEAVVREL